MDNGAVSLKPVSYKRGQNPNSLANLEKGKFPKGYNGNQQGYSLTSLLQDNLKKPLKRPPEDAPARDLLVHSTIEGALKREPTPFREVWDRVDGRLQDKPPPTNIDNRTINIIVSSEKAKELTESVGEIIGKRLSR